MLITITKNIAAGGSTLLRMLKKSFPEIIVLEEDVVSWHLLKPFYDDPKRYAFPFQLETFWSRSTQLKDCEGLIRQGKIVVAERSVFDDRGIFALYHYHQGNITEAEWRSYNTQFDKMIRYTYCRPDYIVYAETDPATCWARKEKRNRDAEESMKAPQYLVDLGNYCTAFAVHTAPDIATRGIEHINCNVDFEHEPDEWEAIRERFEYLFYGGKMVPLGGPAEKEEAGDEYPGLALLDELNKREKWNPADFADAELNQYIVKTGGKE